MLNKEKNPVVFISYAWSTVEHDNWVIDFATRLFSSGVIVKLDKWDLHPGQDKNAFMEQMVLDKEIKFVLAICDTTYQGKANSRMGGVGTETQIISNEVYSKIDQTKYLPIIREFDEGGTPRVPAYFSSRIYIDFSKDEVYEESFEKLLRLIFDKPAVKRPELGTPPAYLAEADPIPNKFLSLQKQAIHAIKSEKAFSKTLIEQYLGGFSEGLEDYAISSSMATPENPFDEIVLASIKSMQGHKEQILELVDSIAVFLPKFEFDIFIDFFSNNAVYFHARKEGLSYTQIDFDNFKFFFQDLFVSMVGILVKRGRYDVVSLLIKGPYFPKYLFRNSDADTNCTFLNHYIRTLDEQRKSRLKSDRVSFFADTIKENQSRVIKFDEYVLSEIILYNVTLLNRDSENLDRNWWYPRTTVYYDHQIDLSFFKKMIVKTHFEKVKGIFNVASRSELIEKSEKSIQYFKNESINFGFYNNPPHLSNLVDMQKLDSK